MLKHYLIVAIRNVRRYGVYSAINILGLAIALAFPIAYYAMTLWLQSFAYRIALDPWIFIAGGCLSFSLVSLTVLIQTYLATSENPVAMLRHE